MHAYRRILLLKIPYCSFPGTTKKNIDYRTQQSFRPIPSLALATLSSFIDKYKSYDYRLSVVDINIEAYTEPSKSIDTSFYVNLLYGRIKNVEYDVLAISAMFVFNYRWVDMAVKLSRRFQPGAKIILGGGYATLFPERCLREHEIDNVVIGEGEATFLHILNRYNSHYDREFEGKFPFDGYASRSECGTVQFCRKESFLNLDDLAPPAWHYFNLEKYFRNSGDRVLPIEGSRGLSI